MQGLNEKLSAGGLHILQGEIGPSLVIAADVKRDLGKTGKHGLYRIYEKS